MEPLLDSLGHSQSQTANSTLETALHTVLLNRHAYPISICTLYMYIYDHIIDIYMWYHITICVYTYHHDPSFLLHSSPFRRQTSTTTRWISLLARSNRSIGSVNILRGRKAATEKTPTCVTCGLKVSEEFWYPLVRTHRSIENFHRHSEFSHSTWCFFHSYVSLPEGKYHQMHCMSKNPPKITFQRDWQYLFHHVSESKNGARTT